ncbi:MAG: type II secretion system protein [Alphaproteobacteria bacterium]|nr:type II secretion system protein [Alphaproteobacteria bacterium]
MKTCSTAHQNTQGSPTGQTSTLNRLRRRSQGGFTLGELLLVLVIIGVLAVVAFRSVQPIIISGRVEATATDTNTAVQRIISAANSSASAAAADYSTITNAVFAAFLSSSNMFKVTGTGGAVAISHRLSTGTAPSVTVTTASSNTQLVVTFSQVHDAACTDLSSLLQTGAVKVVITGAAATTVKDITLVTPTVYNGVTAATACSVGSANSLAFTFQ